MAEPSLTSWFMREIQPHEPALRAYLKVRFPSLADLDNLVQETLTRVLRAREAGRVRSPKALLFTTARNAALDVLRHERVVPFERLDNLANLEVPEEAAGAPETMIREQDLQLLEEALQSLPARCQQILILKKIEGLSYAEIGERMGIKPNTISAQLTIGMLRCRRFLEERGRWKGQRHE